MINWGKVHAYFSLYLNEFELEETLEDLLDHLYTDLKLSWNQIAEITDSYVSASTLSIKAKSLGIKSRGKGGPNHTTELPDILEDEYCIKTNAALAKKYKVCTESIAKLAKVKGWAKKRSGRPKALSVLDATSDNDLEFH